MEELMMLESEFNIGINNNNILDIIDDDDDDDDDDHQDQSSLQNSYSELDFDQLVDSPTLNLSGQSTLRRPITIKTKASNLDIWKLTDYLRREDARVKELGFGEHDTHWFQLRHILDSCIKYKIVIALDDRDELCGFATWTITNDYRNPNKNSRKKNQFASIKIFHVLPRYRQQGIGTKMFLVLKDFLVTKEPRVTRIESFMENITVDILPDQDINDGQLYKDQLEEAEETTKQFFKSLNFTIYRHKKLNLVKFFQKIK
jgi:ribosomal protein S18 acetylase RimI-like enzyme